MTANAKHEPDRTADNKTSTKTPSPDSAAPASHDSPKPHGEKLQDAVSKAAEQRPHR